MTAQLRLVAVEDGGDKWFPIFVRIDLCRPGDLAPGPTFRYPRARAIAATLDRTAFEEWLASSDKESGRKELEGVGVAFSTHSTWNAADYSSHNDYADWPCTYMDRQLHDAQRLAGGVQGPLASSRGYPYFSTVWDLVAHVADLKQDHGWNDGRKDKVNIVAWNYAGRFTSVGYHEPGRDEAFANLDGSALDSLSLTGRIETPPGTIQIPSATAAALVDLGGVEAPAVAELALVNATEQLVDQWKGDLLQEVEISMEEAAQGPEERLRHLLGVGECSHVEFKPYVKLGEGADKKLDRTVFAALGMSNASGGTIDPGAAKLTLSAPQN